MMICLNDINTPVAALVHTDARCQNVLHVSDIDTMYSDMCRVLYSSSVRCIAIGWNEYVRDAHTEDHHLCVTWKAGEDMPG